MSQYTHYKLRTSGQNVFTVPKPLSIITFAAEHPITDVLFPSSSVADHALWLPPVSTQSIISYHPEATLLNQGSALLLWPLINRQWFVFFTFIQCFINTLLICVCMHVCAHRGQKRASDPSKQAFTGCPVCYVGAGIQTLILLISLATNRVWFCVLSFFYLLIAFLKKNNMCVSVWVYTLEGRCPQKPEASDLPAAAVVGICELPDMGTGN